MKVSEKSIEAIQQIVTGNKNLSPYRGGPKLVTLFNKYGANDEYGQGFPSRWMYAEEKLRDINNSPALATLLREVLDPREFVDADFDQQGACDYLNTYLKYDGYEIALVGEEPRIRELKGAVAVEFQRAGISYGDNNLQGL